MNRDVPLALEARRTLTVSLAGAILAPVPGGNAAAQPPPLATPGPSIVPAPSPTLPMSQPAPAPTHRRQHIAQPVAFGDDTGVAVLE